MPRPGEDRSDVGGAAQFNNIGPVPLSVPQYRTCPAFCPPLSVPLSLSCLPCPDLSRFPCLSRRLSRFPCLSRCPAFPVCPAVPLSLSVPLSRFPCLSRCPAFPCLSRFPAFPVCPAVPVPRPGPVPLSLSRFPCLSRFPDQFNNIGPVPLSVSQFNNIGPVPLSVSAVPLSVSDSLTISDLSRFPCPYCSARDLRVCLTII